MKLSTHYVFTLGLLTLISSMFLTFYSALSTSLFLSILGNLIIDRLGHEEKGFYIKRTPRTHTIPRSIAWGFIPSAIGIAFSVLVGYYYLLIPLILSGLLVGPSHMFLDVFTEHGIYMKKKGRWHRFSLAHFRYNNPAANGLAVLAGLIMLLIAMGFIKF